MCVLEIERVCVDVCVRDWERTVSYAMHKNWTRKSPVSTVSVNAFTFLMARHCKESKNGSNLWKTNKKFLDLKTTNWYKFIIYINRTNSRFLTWQIRIKKIKIFENCNLMTTLYFLASCVAGTSIKLILHFFPV